MLYLKIIYIFKRYLKPGALHHEGDFFKFWKFVQKKVPTYEGN